MWQEGEGTHRKWWHDPPLSDWSIWGSACHDDTLTLSLLHVLLRWSVRRSSGPGSLPRCSGPKLDSRCRCDSVSFVCLFIQNTNSRHFVSIYACVMKKCDQIHSRQDKIWPETRRRRVGQRRDSSASSWKLGRRSSTSSSCGSETITRLRSVLWNKQLKSLCVTVLLKNIEKKGKWTSFKIKANICCVMNYKYTMYWYLIVLLLQKDIWIN